MWAPNSRLCGVGALLHKILRGPLLRHHDEVSYDVSQEATQEQSFKLNLLQQVRAEQGGEYFKEYIEYDYLIMCE